MKTLAILLLSIAATTVRAQLTIYARGGINSTSVHARKVTPTGSQNWAYKPGKGQGWQAALHAEYKLSNFIFYSGLGLDKRYFYQRYNNYDDQGVYYKPLYLSMPLGAGYNIGIAKNLAVRVYAGLYGMAGIAGRYHYHLEPAWCEFACPEVTQFNRDIKYGNASINAPTLQLVRYSWGGQLGAGISLFNRFEVGWMYSDGFSPIHPKDYNVSFFRMRANSVDVKVKLATFNHHSKGR